MNEHLMEVKIAPEMGFIQGEYSLSCTFRLTIGGVVFPHYGCMVVTNMEKKKLDPGRPLRSHPNYITRAAIALIKDMGEPAINWRKAWKAKGWKIDVTLSATPEFMVNELKAILSPGRFPQRFINPNSYSWCERIHKELYVGKEYGEERKKEPPISSSFSDFALDNVPLEAIYAIMKRGKRIIPNYNSLFHALFHLHEIRMTWRVYPIENVGWGTKLENWKEVI